jgi:hypothetical protein
VVKIFRLVRLLRLDPFKSVEGEAINPGEPPALGASVITPERAVTDVCLPRFTPLGTAVSPPSPGVVRLFKLMCVFLFVLHLIACGYWFLASGEGFGSDEWVPPEELSTSSLSEKYAFAYYWAILVTIGNDAKPVTYNEHVYSGFIMLAGIAVFATIVGGASSLLSNLDLPAQAQKQQMDSINQVRASTCKRVIMHMPQFSLLRSFPPPSSYLLPTFPRFHTLTDSTSASDASRRSFASKFGITTSTSGSQAKRCTTRSFSTHCRRRFLCS